MPYITKESHIFCYVITVKNGSTSPQFRNYAAIHRQLSTHCPPLNVMVT